MRVGVLATVLAALSALPMPALGDGKAFIYTDYESIRPVDQNEQVAAIHFRDGRQTMVIAIHIEVEDEDKALWIFPVPGSPTQTTVDVVDRFPRFRGTDIRAEAANRVELLMEIASFTQIYPALVLPHLGGRLQGSGVDVGAVVEKWGIRIETLTASSASGLADYLHAEHPAITPEQLAPFDPYFNAGYVLVVAWVASRDELLAEFPEYTEHYRRGLGRARRPCLLVKFATDQAFYPLRPTGSYGDMKVKVRLYVLGYVQPKTDPSLGRLLNVRHFEQGRFPDDTPLEFTAGLPLEEFAYTRIRASTQARNFVDDLWFVPYEPSGLRYARLIQLAARPYVGAPLQILLIAVLSYVCGGLSGLAVCRRWCRPAGIGLFNLLTLLGLLLAVDSVGIVPARQRSESQPWSRAKTVYLVLFTILFTAGTTGLKHLLIWPLGSFT